jgi:uncharacterized protein (DUF302 family)
MKNARTLAIGFALCAMISTKVWCADGMVALKSPFDPVQTMDRLVHTVEQHGLTVFARIDHSAGAAKAGLSLRPTELLIFGNPARGTALMLCAQTMGIELPLKALVWRDEAGQVWLGYNDPRSQIQRHGVQNCTAAQEIEKALGVITSQALAP